MAPPLVLSVLLGSLYGLLCHAFVGRRWRQLPLYWAVGLLGFLGGYLLAVLGGREVLQLGTVPILEATLGSWLALGLTAWLVRRRGRPTADVG